jgi:hypothetical protein
MYDAKLAAELRHVIPGIAFKQLEFMAIFTKGMKEYFLGGESRLEPSAPLRIDARRNLFLSLVIDIERSNQFREVVAGYVCSCLKCGGLELLKAGMIKDLGNGTLHGRLAYLTRHDRTFAGNVVRFYIGLYKGLEVVFRELIRVDLGVY